MDFVFETAYELRGGDYANAGRASTEIKDILKTKV